MDSDGVFHLLPIQIIPIEQGAIVRRGSTRLHVGGETAVEVLHTIAAATATGAKRHEILEEFAPETREDVDALLGELLRRRIVADLSVEAPHATLLEDEDRADIFYWTMQTSRAAVTGEVGAPSIAVIGVNAVSAALVAGLRDLGLASEVVDHPLLQNIGFVDQSGHADPDLWPHEPPTGFQQWVDGGAEPDLIVATSDFGGLSMMRDWNQFCLAEGISFLGAVLHDYVGYVGPLVVPGQTACFECFLLRQDSNLEAPGLIRASDQAAFQGQVVDGMVPFSAPLLGGIAAFEIHRYFARSVLGWRPDTVIEIDLLASTMKPRKFLRVPRCPGCGAGSRWGRVTIDAHVELLGNPQEI